MEDSDRNLEFENGLPIRTKLSSKEIKEKIYNKLFKNLCIAILVCLYFIFVNMGFKRLDNIVFENDLHVFAATLIVSTIIIFEKSYKNNDNELAVHGVEMLMVSIITLFMPYIYFHRGNTLKTLYALFEVYIAIYYLLKCFIIYKLEMRKAILDLSDIKDIIEISKSKSYLDEKNNRKFDKIVEEDYKNTIKKESEKEEMRRNKRESILNLLRRKKKTAEEEFIEDYIENEPFSEEMLNSFYNMNEKKNEKTDNDENIEYSKGKPKKKRGRKPVNKKLVKSIATETRRRKKD